MHICWSHALKKFHSMTFLHLSHFRQSSAPQSTPSIFTHLPYFLVFITSIVLPYKSFSHFSASHLKLIMCPLFATSLFATSCCYIRLKIIIILFTKGQHNCLFCFYLRPLFSVSKHFATLLHQCSKRQLQVVHCCVWKGFSRVTFPFSVGTLPNLAAHFLQPF